MALEYLLEAQSVSEGTSPDLKLTRDPAIDQPALRLKGYSAGRIMTQVANTDAGLGAVGTVSVIKPMDGLGASGQIPYGTLINGPGRYAESIGPSGSGKMPVTRAHPMFRLFNDLVDPICYVAAPTTPYKPGGALYCGTGALAGVWTPDLPAGAIVVGICNHVPTVAEPWLGVTQLF